MRIVHFAVTLAAAAASLSCASMAAQATPDEIIALERAALDRWGRGDPQGYIEVYGPEITYFDPFQPTRLDGIDALKAMLAPITGLVKIDRYEMIRPLVQRHGNAAILSFQLVSHVTRDGQPVTVRWNSTAVYARVNGQLKSVHSHWSFTGRRPRGSGATPARDERRLTPVGPRFAPNRWQQPRMLAKLSDTRGGPTCGGCWLSPEFFCSRSAVCSMHNRSGSGRRTRWSTCT